MLRCRDRDLNLLSVTRSALIGCLRDLLCHDHARFREYGQDFSLAMHD